MSSAGSSLGVYVAVLAVVNIAYAAIALRRPQTVAEANRAFIESGEETHFEQRRAWQAYGTTPETDSHRVRRRAIRLVAINLVLVAAIVLIEWL